MAALMGSTRIGLKQTGTVCSVPNTPKARLMYYLSAMCNVLEVGDDDSDIRRLRDYENHHRLTESETDQLVLLCALLSPDVLLNKCIFQDDDMCGEYANEFYELSAVSHRMIVASSIVIGGQRKRVQKIMCFKMSWLRNNYIQPLTHFADRAKEQERQRQRRQESDCTIL